MSTQTRCFCHPVVSDWSMFGGLMVLGGRPSLDSPHGGAPLSISSVTVSAHSRGRLFTACTRLWACGRHPGIPSVKGGVKLSWASAGFMCVFKAAFWDMPGHYTCSDLCTAWVWPKEGRASQCFSGHSIVWSWPDVCFPDLVWKV